MKVPNETYPIGSLLFGSVNCINETVNFNFRSKVRLIVKSKVLCKFELSSSPVKYIAVFTVALFKKTDIQVKNSTSMQNFTFLPYKHIRSRQACDLVSPKQFTIETD